jgi:two-component system sensor histidine kinase RstB
MTRLFLTLYFGIAAALVMLFFLNKALAPYLYEDIVREAIIAQGRGIPEVAESMAKKMPLDEVVSDIQRSFATSDVPVHMHAYQPQRDPALKPGEIQAPDPDNFLMHYRSRDGQWMMVVGPVTDSNAVKNVEYGSRIVVFIWLAAGCLIWVALLKRRLKRLESATLEFAGGNLEVRAPVDGGWRIGSLNANFNTMADRISRLIHSHKQLTNAVAHELRSPIFRMRFRLEQLGRSQNPAMSPVMHEKVLSGALSDLDELDDLVDELLTHARLERTDWDIPLQPTPMASWLQAQQQRLQNNSILPIDWSLRADSHASIDSRLLSRALDNLLSNANTHARTQISVQLEMQDGKCLLHVDDDGIGIPVEDRERIFDPFVRLDTSRTRDTGGHGLGLSITREAVRLQGGHIHVSDSPLGGARFTIELPATPGAKTDTVAHPH